jgi:hypothetical protein
MKILSHRGFWLSAADKNTHDAFTRSFAAGFGTETDLRDLDGQLVIAHDPPLAGAMTAEAFLQLHAQHNISLPLALNIKADGLQKMLGSLLARTTPMDAFVFDMSVPDTLHWLNAGVPVFVRHSDIEPDPVLLSRCSGIWLDAFHADWWDVSTIRQHLEAGRRVCIVSPELHRRPHLPVWDKLAAAGDLIASAEVMLCTDYPDTAKEYFSHEN